MWKGMSGIIFNLFSFVSVVTRVCLLRQWKRKRFGLEFKGGGETTTKMQGKGTPSQGASENKRRQPINTIAKTQKTSQVKSFKYNKVYLHKYKNENLEQKNKT